MGGHAAFIWPAFAIALIVLCGLALLSRWGLTVAERDHAQARREAGRDGPRNEVGA
ncbi:MAG: heme exporter protein CcmD [Ferrovibrio sp.]|nr:MAG: heme exporter protein CcmD [Ferrovibrio sp.]